MKKYLSVLLLFSMSVSAKNITYGNEMKKGIDCSEYATNAWIVMTLKQKKFDDKRIKRTYYGYALMENIDKLLVESKDYNIEKTQVKKELVANKFKNKIEQQCRNKI